MANVEALLVSMATAMACRVCCCCCERVFLGASQTQAHKSCQWQWKQSSHCDIHIDDALIRLPFSCIGPAKVCQNRSIVKHAHLFIYWLDSLHLICKVSPSFNSTKIPLMLALCKACSVGVIHYK